MADVTVTPANVSLSSGSPDKDRNANAAITIGSSLYIDAAGKYGLADADVELTAGTNGVAVALSESLADGQPIIAARAGDKVVFGAGTFVAGEIYVISANAGKIAPYADLVSTDYITVLGYAEDTSILVIDPIITGIAKT